MEIKVFNFFLATNTYSGAAPSNNTGIICLIKQMAIIIHAN
jgi:hypothetical protein